MTLPPEAAAAILDDPNLSADFAALCDCGGRQAGTPSERQALDLLRHLGAVASNQPATIIPTPYPGWQATHATLNLIEGQRRTNLLCLPLLRSAATEGLEAEILPIGRGTPEEFAALAPALQGRIALVRHEYMFAPGHIHRRRKLEAAIDAGAAAFLIAGPLPAALVAGGATPAIPALGISPESAARLSPRQGLARAHITLRAKHAEATTETLLFDLKGPEPGIIVLSAHLDGHAPAESAIDNATGLAAALAVTRALAPHAAQFSRTLRLAFFSAEEWALTGSRVYLAALPENERNQIALNINLDSIAGHGTLTALCSNFPALATWTSSIAPIQVYLPLMQNSDHANFAAHGIPALRLVAGFNEPASNLRHVLTAADTRDKVSELELRTATLTAAALTWAALTAPTEELRALNRSSPPPPAHPQSQTSQNK